jgi:hypothetical protein
MLDNDILQGKQNGPLEIPGHYYTKNGS